MLRLLPRPGPILICLAAFLFATTSASSYWTLYFYWPDSTSVVMQLQLGPTSIPLDDGSGSWNDSAADALSLWNAHLETIQFQPVFDSTTTQSSGDGYNSVFFSDSIFGDDFGENVLAVTIGLEEGTTASEADVLVNRAHEFNSYRGNLREGDPAVYDIHRILLHEFGHAFGLGHPDEHGLLDPAIMNSVISDLDHIVADDIAGAAYLYGIRIYPEALDFRVGQPLSYQVSSNVPGLSYEATDLPNDLSIDSKTGLITGVVPLNGGYYDSTVTVHGARTSATELLFFSVLPDPPLNLRASHYWDANRVVMDASRHRAYITISSPPSIAILDTDTLSLIKTISTESEPFGMAISLDGMKLYVAQNKQPHPGLIVIDLTTFATLPNIPTPFRTYDVAAGLDNRLFITQFGSAGIAQIDADTGTVLSPFPYGSFDGRLQISPDLKTLYAGAVHYGPSILFAVDVSGDIPVTLRQTPFNDYGSGIGDFKLSHDGTFLCVPNDVVGAVKKLFSFDFTSPGEFIIPNLYGGGSVYTGPAVEISPDDSTVFVTDYQSANPKTVFFDLFDSVTREYLRSVDLSGFGPTSFVLDPAGRYLFAPSNDSQFVPQLRVYDAGLGAPALHPPKPASLLNVSTRMLCQNGESVLIGGFILAGKEPKQIAIRGIGPSLPLGGRLSNPVLSLYDGNSALVASNDNWNSTRNAVLATGLAPNDEHEAAIAVELAPGSYTAILSGGDTVSGVALVEVYDLTPDSDSAVANISTRGEVESGDNVMIGGFIIGADTSTEVLVRAIGPSLTQFGVMGALQDPVLELHDSAGVLLFQNDNWRSTQQADIVASGLPPSDDRESAILATLQPGSYTAIVRGQNDSTGVGLVEVYNLDASAATSK